VSEILCGIHIYCIIAGHLCEQAQNWAQKLTVYLHLLEFLYTFAANYINHSFFTNHFRTLFDNEN
jgi:hypothetical protein